MKPRKVRPCVNGCGTPVRCRENRTGLCRKCYSGPLHRNWKGGTSIDKKGYVLLLSGYPFEHPEYVTAKNGRIMEHVYKMSCKLGRPLHKDETVHHINGVKDDNRLGNLELWSKNHPAGQRVKDQLKWARKIIARYDGVKL